MNKKLEVIDELQQHLSSMRGKLESPRESEDEKRDASNGDEETQETDPLIALAGTLKCEVTDIEDRIKDARDALQAEMRVVEGAYKDHPDPLIALLGTLECDVTDIAERHDDYIAAALLAELRGDNDE
ncbi:hypothetical protein F4X73_18895 [Candidatus Poribacteria bacterium]|nr:hypothetical protein [Candidatus Poribacteria bacterium]